MQRMCLYSQHTRDASSCFGFFPSLSPVSSLVEFLVPHGLGDVHFGGACCACGGIRSKLFPDA